MDMLAPPTSPAPANAPAPADLLRERSRRRRWRGPLLCINAGFLLTLAVLWKLHPSWLRVESWSRLPLVWAIGIGVTLVAAFALWVRGRSPAPLRHARSLDENLRAMNRLEAAALLASEAHPIARAQREETAAFLADHGPARHGPGPLEILSLAVAALILAHLATLTVWTRPWQRPAAAPVKTAPTPPPAAVPPKASITWKTPKSEIKASSVEEVPLEAAADSANGLRDLVLEAAVNGEPRPGIPLPADALAKPGAHPIQTSLYLDQLDVQPYDMVSYFLRAKRIAPEPLPDTVSAVQFVEIKPFRDDIREVPGGDSKGAFALITALKVAQLNLLKQNFVLGHAEISRETAAWKKENARVGDEQATLGAKSDEVISKFIQDGIPANIVDLLRQSRTLMAVAAEKIRDTKNADALTAQGKSLGFITEIEKYFIKLAAKDGSSKGGPKNVKDPFEKPKDFEMKQRFETVAGGLEALAREQLKLAQELAKADPKDPNAGHPSPAPPGAETKRPDPNRIEGTFTERQTLISQRIGALLNGQVLPPEVNSHLESSQDHARESLHQLDADDIARSREPAAAAARELRLAIQTLDRLGQDDANDKLADALNRLNKAADQAREATQAKSDAAAKKAADDAAAQAADARDKLADAARQQQEAGSAQAAARLAEAARALDDPKFRETLKQWHDQPGNAALAKAAADQLARAADQIADQPGSGARSSEDVAKLVERVERTRRNFERLAATQPSQDAAAQSRDKERQTPGQDNEPPNGSAPPDKEGQRKAAQNSDRNGKDGQEIGQGADKGKEGSGKGQEGKGNEGQEGEAAAPTQAQDEGHGSGRDRGQGGEGKGNGESSKPGQPTPGHPGQTGLAGSTTGRGPGAGKGSADDPSTDKHDPAGSPPADSHHDENGTAPSAHGRGSSTRSSQGGNGPGHNPPFERQAQELLADLRDESLEARIVLASPDAKQVLEELYPDIHSPRPPDNAAVVASFERIRAPLDRLIILLRAERDRSQRQHELTDQTQEKAPPAYGEAVADYFEQLSRDYRSEPAATPPPADSARPTP